METATVTDANFSDVDLDNIETMGQAAEIELARRQFLAGDPLPYVRLQWGDKVILDGFQIDILKSMADPLIREIWVKGNTGCGKGAVAAIGVCAYFDLFADARVVITRDKYETAVSVMLSEVAKWFRRMRFPPAARVQNERIVDADNQQHAIVCANPLQPEGFAGVHSEHVLFLFDEATSVPSERFDLANTQATKFLALFNPRTTDGPCRAVFGHDDPDRTQTVLGPYGRRRLITIGGMDCLNVRSKCLRRAVSPPGGIEINEHQYAAGDPISREDFACRSPIIPGQTCYDEFQGHLQNPDPDWVAVYAHGRFPQEDPERQIIRGKWLAAPGRLWQRFNRVWERTKDRHNKKFLQRILNKWHPVEAFGLDIALSAAGDESVLTAGGSRGVRQQHTFRFKNARELVNWVIETAKESYGVHLTRGGIPVGVDCDGLGLPIAQMLAEKSVRVIEIRGAATSEVDPKMYVNFRAEAYGQLGVRLDPENKWAYDLLTEDQASKFAAPGDPGSSARGGELTSRSDRPMVFMIPPDPELHRQIRAHEKIFPVSDSMKFKVTQKDKSPGNEDDNKIRSVKEKIGRSPDHSDSLVYFDRALQHKGFDLGKWLESGAF